MPEVDLLHLSSRAPLYDQSPEAIFWVALVVGGTDGGVQKQYLTVMYQRKYS
jgi:hypothetical protein